MQQSKEVQATTMETARARCIENHVLFCVKILQWSRSALFVSNCLNYPLAEYVKATIKPKEADNNQHKIATFLLPLLL